MNEEKEDVCYGGLKGYGKTYCEMIRLQQENQQLHNKIDKAIEILDKTDYEYSSRTELFNIVLETTETLKDSDVDG